MHAQHNHADSILRRTGKTRQSNNRAESVHRRTQIWSRGIFYFADTHIAICFFHIHYDTWCILLPKEYTYRNKTEAIVHINGFTYHEVIQQFFAKVLPPKKIVRISYHSFIIKANSFCGTLEVGSENWTVS